MKVKRAFGLKVILDRTLVGEYFVDGGVMLGSVIVGGEIGEGLWRRTIREA